MKRSGKTSSNAPLLWMQVVIFAVCLLFLTLGMDRELNPYDEGVILTGAMRVAAGDVPHRDFFANYGPAQFYILAYFFKFFGQSVAVERALDVLVRALTATLCFTVTARYCRTWIALGAAILCVLWLFSMPFYGYPIFPVTLLALATTALILRALDPTPSLVWLFAAGGGVGLIALFRYDVGFYVFAALGLVIPLYLFRRSNTSDGSMSATAKALGAYILGTSAVFLPAAIAYLAAAPLAPFIHDIFHFPVRLYPQMRTLPFPGLLESLRSSGREAVYLPIVICAATLYHLVFGRVGSHVYRADSHRARPDSTWALIAFSIVSSALYFKGLVRVSNIHVVLSLIPSLVALALLLERSGNDRLSTRVIVAALCTVVTLLTVRVAYDEAKRRLYTDSSVFDEIRSAVGSRGTDTRATWCGQPRELHKVACFILGTDREQAVRFLVRNTKPEERIFVGLTRHDKIFMNDNVTYFAADRLPATRWHHFDPGLQTSAAVQNEIVAELELHRVRYILLSSEWDDVAEPNESAKSSGILVLDEYIRRHYRPHRAFGKLLLLAREG